MIIRVGDPHAKPSNLKELKALFDFVIRTALEQKASHVELLGDLFDTMLIIRLDVMNFWQETALKFAENKVQAIAIVGNHDLIGDKQREKEMSALDSLKFITPYFKVVDKPMVLNGIAYMPYRSSEKEFIDEALGLLPQSNGTLICHQTFEGAKYDNGMYAPHGFSLDILNGYKQIISGHIHTYAKYANLLYIGTAKWDSLTDANQLKGIWLFEDGKDPEIVHTDKVCTPIRLIKVIENEQMPEIVNTDRNYIEMIGNSSWIAKASRDLKHLGKIIPRPTDSKSRHESKKTDISSLQNYAKEFCINSGFKTEDVLDFIGGLR